VGDTTTKIRDRKGMGNKGRFGMRDVEDIQGNPNEKADPREIEEDQGWKI
jgi:hypothetical protein